MGVSTHVLDTEVGRPAAGIALRLERAADRTMNDRATEWSVVRDGLTDADGRCRTLIPDAEKVEPGVYRVRFETGPYYERTGREGLYPFVEIAFQVRDGRHYHIPLLLTANGYSTYRGS